MMTTSSPRGLVWVLIPLFLVPVSVIGQERDPQIQKILDDWKKRQQRPKPIRYRFEGTLTFPKEALTFDKRSINPKAPPVEKDAIMIDKGMLLLDFSSGRYRLEREADGYNLLRGVDRQSSTTTFDGQKVWTTSRLFEGGKEVKKPDQPDVAILSGKMDWTPMDLKLLPLFAAHGIVVIGEKDQILPGKWQFEPDTTLLSVHGRGAYDNRTCLLLRTHPLASGEAAYFKEFWVDPARESALVRIVDYLGRHPTTELNIQYQRTKDGWLTKGWNGTRRRWSTGFKTSTPVYYTRFQVTEIILGPTVDEKDFQLEIKPGMLVRQIERKGPPLPPHLRKEGKSIRREGNLYRAGDDLTLREVVFEGGVERYRWNPVWPWVLAVLGVLGIGGLFWWRRRATTPDTGRGEKRDGD
ncbi:MAG: hypothetical protein L0Z62_30335 [Gemmataceae bacterium]|nr:hypothetical protein [Gemmataceae bacterium]